MRPNYLVDITQKIFALIFLICSSSLAIAQNVLILYDNSPTNTNTVALKTSLQNQGFQVTISAVSESFWNNTNPSLTGFHAVIHLNGSTYATEMPIAGQTALVNFVQNEGGVYVGFEWNAYQVSESEMLTMVDLIPIVRSSGQTQNITYTTVPAQASHPVLNGIPASFSLTNTGANIGSMRAYGTDPAVTLMMQASNAGLVYRAFGTGHVLMFSHAGNYVQSGASGAALSDTIVGQLIYNMIEEYADTKKRSLNFDGTNDFVQGSAAGFPSGNSARTMEAWIRTTKNGNGSIFEYGAVNVNQRSGLLCVNNHLFFVGQSNDLEGTITINDGTWHHVAMTHNGTTTNLYVDGVLDVTATKTLSTTPSHFRIGMRGNSISEQFDGNIDEVRLWGKAMSTAEIQAKANCELSGNECGLLAYYSFNNQNALSSENNAGQIVLGDSSGNGHDGALNNFALNGNSSNWVAQSDSISNSCSATLDTLAPIVFAIDTTIYLDASGNAAITVTQIDSASSDNCNIASRVLSDSTFDCTEVGTNNITLTVTDVNGNVSVVSSVVTVIDSITPTTIAIDTTIYLSGAGTASVTATQIGYLSSDNCATFNLALSDSVFDCTDADSTLAIILTGSDSYGNSSTDTSYITVLDTTAPVATAQNLTVYLDANGAASITPNDADNGSADNCPIDYLATSDSAFTCADAGLTLNLELYAFDPSGNSDTAGFSVTVLDTTSPIVFAIDTTIYLDASGNAAITVTQIDSASSDNCNIASRVLSDSTFDCTEVGTNNITLTVTDVNGNVSVVSSVVTVIDSITPTTIAIDTTIYLSGAGTASVTATQIGYLSSDNCATFNLALSDSVFDCTDADSTLAIILTGSDSYGNSSTDTSYITVLDTTAPVATAQNLTVYLDANGAASITPNDADNGSADNCPIDYLATSDSAFTCADAGLTLNLELYAFDPSGNSDTAGFSVTVLDTTSPIVFAIDTTIYLDASGNAAITVTQIDSASSDNCNIASRVLSDSTFDCTEVGTNNITLTVTDVNGNVSVVSSVVTVIDSITPTTIAIDTTIYLSGAGTASVTATQIGYLSSDNCATFNLALSDSVFDCTDADSTLAIILTGSDSYGNSSTDTSYITVLDTTAPVATAQNLTVYLDANGAASITPNDADNGSADNCPIDYLATSDSAFTCADAGLTLNLELYAFDPSGNSDTAGFSVTVLDTTSPIVFAIDTTIYLDASGNAAITVTQIDSASSDNCNIASRVLSDSTFDCTEVGTNNITLTVTDVNGNVSVVSSVVTVIDSITPTTIAIDTTIYLSGAGTASVTATQIGYLSSDNCATFNLALSDSVFDCTDADSTLAIILTGSDSYGNSSTDTSYITVLDTTAPVATAQNLTVYLDANGAASITPNDADNGSADNCPIDYLATSDSAFTCADAGLTLNLELYAFDPSGNSDTAGFSVTVLDTTSPIVFAIDTTIYLDASGNAAITVTQIDSASSDNCNIASRVLSDSTFDCTEVGTNNITLTVTDVNGNVSVVSSVVTVIDSITPTTIAIDTTIYLSGAGTASVTATQIGYLSSDNCATFNLALSDSVFDCTDAGTTQTIVLTVTDPSGNTDTALAYITIVDLSAPVLITQNLTIYLDSLGAATITADSVNNGTYDSCGIASLSISTSSFTCADTGANTIDFIAADVNGNADTVQVIITVLDTQPAVVIAQNLTLQLDASGQATTTALAVDNGSFDNCGIALVSISQSTFSCADTAAPQIITLYVEDVSGNIDSTTVLMTIEDNVAPTVVTTNFTVGLDSFGFASILADSIDDGSSDNCSIESIWLDQNTFSCANVNNPVTITLFVRDVSGNINFGTAVVTVIDTIAPQIVVQNDTAYLDSMGTVSIAATLLNNGTWDSCGVNYLTLSQGAFDCSDFGTQTIIFSATDFNGNTSTANVDITILDMIAPTIIIQDLIVYLDSFGVASITADSVDIGTWDSCGMASIIIDSSSFNCANHNDTLPVIFTATDIHGNVSFDTATFYIYDTLAPFIFAHSDTFYLDSAGQYVVSYTQLNDSTSDNCGVDSMYLSDTLFTCLTVDSIVNIWFYAHDIHGNLDSLELDITMLDTIRPQFLCPDGIIVSNDFDQCGAIVSFTFPTASDNCTVDSIIQIDPTGLDSGSFFPVGFTELTYVAYDQSLNTDTCSFIIEVQDTAAPVLFCVPDTAICDTIFTFDLPSYTDNCSGFDVIQIGGIETGLFYPVGVTVNEFVVTDSYGNSDTCLFEVLRHDFPTASNAGLDQEKCEEYTATLDGNDPFVGIGFWTQIKGIGTIDDTLNNQATISGVDTGLTLLEWRIENKICPIERDTMTIREYVNPTAANAGEDVSICDTNETYLAAVETDFGFGRWILPFNGATIDDTTDFESLVTDLELGSYAFTWRVTNGVCPVTTDQVTLDVVPYPVIDAGENKFIFLPSSIELEASSDLKVVFNWTPKFSLINDETAITTATPNITTTYMVAGTTEFGCTSVNFVDVVVNESLDLPTAFTPDGDNFNDVWNLKELSSYPDNVVKIYNRWGNLIFESTGYQEAWEGTYNGEPLSSGSYFYVIDLNVGELKPFTGSITIIK